jgi:LPS export ABC transporter protein LptC
VEKTSSVTLNVLDRTKQLHIGTNTYFFSMLVALLFLSVMFTSCSEERVKPPISSIGVGHDIPTQESWNAIITFTDSGKVTAILHSGHIASFTERRYTLLDSNIVVDFFDQYEKHTSVLTAQRGRVNDVTHDFEAHDHVVVVSDSGTTLRTEELYWNNTTRKINTPAFVEIVSPTEHIFGHSFESDQSLKHYAIFKVTGQAKANE